MGVSIIMPAYNSERYIALSLESVLAQTVRDWELIIVNDGSTDQTETIAETFSHLDKRIRVVHQTNAGISQARNRGFAETRADYEYCMFLDSDDVLEPDALELLLCALENDLSAVGAHGLARYIDIEGMPIADGGGYVWPARRRGIQGNRLKVWPVTEPTTFEALAYSNFILASGLIMRRAPKQAVGDFDPSLKIAEDYHLWLRLSRLGHIIFLNRVVFSYRRHEGNITQRHRLMLESMDLARGKIYSLADLDDRERHIILIGYRYHELFRVRLSLSYAARRLARGGMIDAYKGLRTAMKYFLSSLKGL
jgi:glycosyltransferase involved in cell wall biosynthesis